jgi:hypothetical protein
LENEGSFRGVYEIADAVISSHETPKFLPRFRATSPKVKAADVMLLDSSHAWRLIVKPSVVAEHNPALRSHDIQPRVIFDILRKLVLVVVVVLNSKWRLGFPQ